MSRLEHVRHPGPDTVALLRRFLGDAAVGPGQPPVGEAKRTDLARDDVDWSAVLAFRGADLVGYAHLRWHEPGHRPVAVVETAVAGDATGMTAELLDGACRAVAAAGGGLLWSWAHRVTDVGATPQARAGFGVQRRLAVMRRSLDPPPEPSEPPDGVSISSYRPGTDDEAFLRTNNAVFEGHPENGGWDLGELHARRDLDWFDAEDLLLAWRQDDLLGFHWTKRHTDDPGLGEVYVLGIDPAAQGLGLGRTLLVAGLRHLHHRGCDRVVLYVDTAQSAAVRLYESAGFTHLYEEVCYELSVPSSSAPEGSSL